MSKTPEEKPWYTTLATLTPTSAQNIETPDRTLDDIALQSRQDDHIAIPSNTVDYTWVEPYHGDASVCYFKKQIHSKTEKQLRKGTLSIDATLVLHDIPCAMIAQHLSTQLKHLRSHSQRTIRIIHGKADHADFARLKSLAIHELRRIDYVLAFASAPRHLGGTGALLCILQSTSKDNHDS